ncbi:MAG: hypothetical protein RBS05_18815 [Zoogloea oleivorans]|nr:hypothetical protein [Zoogloea oleivorans]MDY0037968.1 hypothetical protein [Zoogloea oleivorans]
MSLVETARLVVIRQRIKLRFNRVPHGRREKPPVAVLEFQKTIQIAVFFFPGHEHFHQRLQNLQGDNGPVEFSLVEFFTVHYSLSA